MENKAKINWNDHKYSLADVLAEADKGNLDAMYSAVARLLDEKYYDDEDALALIVHYLQTLVGAGHLASMITLGSYYENGIGVEKDVQKAIDLYIEAAINGVDYGYERIGLMYFWGKNVPKDYKKAWKYLTKGRKKGQEYFGSGTDTCYALGEMYRNGWYVKHNTSIATKYFTKLIEFARNDPFGILALFQLLRIYLDNAKDENDLLVIEKKLAIVKKVFYDKNCDEEVRMCITEEDIKELEAGIERIKNGPKVIKLLYDDSITEEEFDADIVPALRALRHEPQDVLFIEDEDGNCLKIHQVEVMCCDDEKGTYNILVNYEGKLHNLAPDENIGLREVIDLLRLILTDKGILDLSHWEDVTRKLTGQDYGNICYFEDKYMRNE